MIYLIDVDGVIFDSSKQLIIDSFNTYRRFFKNTRLFGNIKFTLNNYKKILNKNKKTVDLFNHLKNYTKTAEELILCFYLIDNKIDANSDNEFRAKLQQINKKILRKWHYEFYKQRYLFQKQKEWKRLIKSVPEMVDFVKINSDKVMILSNKDLKTIHEVFIEYNIILPDEKIYSQEHSINKNEKIKMIMRSYKIKPEDLILIDDNFLNLKEALNLGVNCYLATWGYNDKEQQEKVEKLGIKLLKLSELKGLKF